MKSDVKIGIALGIIVAVGAIIWFTMRGEKTETPSPVIVVPETPAVKPAATPAPAPVIPPISPAPANIPAPAAAPAAAPAMPPPATLPASPPAPLAVPAPVAPPAELKPPPQDTDRPKERFHTIAPGETLSQIAEMYYGQSKHWNVIYEANRNVIKDKDILIPGKKLKIPYPEEIAATKIP